MDATGNSSSYDEKIRTRVEDALNDYSKLETQQLYKELTKLIKEKCEELLRSINEKDDSEKDDNKSDNNKNGIEGVVQGRTKKYSSLEKKMKDLEKDHDKGHKSYEWLFEKLQNPENNSFEDLKGCEYLEKWLEELEKDPNEVSDFRTWVSEGKDIYKHPEMGDLAGVRIGLYFPNDIVKVVEEIGEHFDIRHLFGTVTGGRDIAKGRNLDIYKHLDGPWLDRDNDYWEHYGYRSWQMVVEWKKPPHEDLKSLRVEIQVGTVVTQAWAEVQHSIIYKYPERIRSTPAMRRMIDAINGLAITTDIMLKDLRENLEQAEKRAKHLDIVLDRGIKLYQTSPMCEGESELAISYREALQGLCKRLNRTWIA